MDMSLSKLWELVMDREAWRAAVHGVANGQTRLRDWTELIPYIAQNHVNWGLNILKLYPLHIPRWKKKKHMNFKTKYVKI